ncbi:MAG TPA: TetR/AcrR family transcriptional regulator [Euzebyales bacterium]|nr:TetR/AcrR family transcriptional regulator [Euzebyales bacterium]
MTDQSSAHATEEPVPPPPWQRRLRETGTRRAPLDRERIVETALAILDRDGLNGLSMRKIADELETGPASLYWHVGSKDELLDLVFDHVIGELHLPDPDPDRWAEQLKDVARAMRDGIARHRDIVRVSMGRFPVGPNALRFTERVLAILRAGGLSDDLAVSGSYLLTVVVNGFMLEEAPGEGPQPDADFLRAVSEYFASLPGDRFPNLVAVAGTFTLGDADERFELLVDLFVDGLAARART